MSEPPSDERKPWAEPRVELVGTVADARNLLLKRLDDEGLTHKMMLS